MSQQQPEHNLSNISSSSANGNTSNSSLTSLVPGGVVTTQNISTVIKPKENNKSMQFVKIKPPDLSKQAVEQIRVAQESKITKDKLKESEEEWQSNLLKWKSKRRQHFVGPSGSEEANEDEQNNNNLTDNTGRKVKTFAQMIEQRSRTNNRLNFNLQRYIGSDDQEEGAEENNGHSDDEVETNKDVTDLPDGTEVKQTILVPPPDPSPQPQPKSQPQLNQTLPKPPPKLSAPTPPPPDPSPKPQPQPHSKPQLNQAPPKPPPKLSAPTPQPIPPPPLDTTPQQPKSQTNLSPPKPPPKNSTHQHIPNNSAPLSPTKHQARQSPPQLSLPKPQQKPSPPQPPPKLSVAAPPVKHQTAQPPSHMNAPKPQPKLSTPQQTPEHTAPLPSSKYPAPQPPPKPLVNHGTPSPPNIQQREDKDRTVLSVSGKRRCSSCKEELGRGAAAFVVESLNLVYHTNCFKCSVCHVDLSNGFRGVDVRVHAGALHCQNCYSKDGLNYSRV